MRPTTITTTVALMLASPVFGHHSDAALDMETVVTHEGIITEFNLRNPHTYFSIESTNELGEQIEWTVQMGSAIVASRRGWRQETLPVGERVTVVSHPSRDGRPYGLFVSIQNADGVALPITDTGSVISRPAQGWTYTGPGAVVEASTLEGRWIVDSASLIDYPGGLDQLTRAELTLTARGAVAQAAYDETSAENPELSCIGRPTPGMIIYTDLYPLEIEFNEGEETIAIRHQYFDSERIVYMDGRAHPESGERFFEGHSIGRWESGTLIVDTRNFEDHRSPYQNGIPSGGQKHVVERYELMENGTRMALEFMLEDPEYLTGSMTHRRELVYSPQLDMTPFNCDLESTRGFLSQ